MADDPNPAPILTGDAPTAPIPTPQEATAAAMQLAAWLAEDQGLPRGRWRFRCDDPYEWVARTIHQVLGRRLSGCAVWLRVFDDDIGLLAVLHSQSEYEMELLLVANRGALDRTTLRLLAVWAYQQVAGEGLRRVVLRIPAGCDRLKDLARRAGFRPEGVARGYFADCDASIWALARSDAERCRWALPLSARTASPPREAIPSNQRVH